MGTQTRLLRLHNVYRGDQEVYFHLTVKEIPLFLAGGITGAEMEDLFLLENKQSMTLESGLRVWRFR
jgi:hypothetical protein